MEAQRSSSPMSTHNFETVSLGHISVPRLWIGLWQLSSPAWGTAPASKIRAEMARHFQRGFSAFDMADHYGSAEILFGQFRKSVLQSTSTAPVCATKWCIFRPLTDPVSRESVESAVRERITRTMGEDLDMLQVHWQDYNDSNYLYVFRHLADIKRDGTLRIRALGLVNFDSQRVDEICLSLEPGEIATNQVQFSLVDTRPLYGMSAICRKHGVKLLTYGTLCGGFLADRWLGAPQPDPYHDPLTPSQRKYLDVILGAWGGWDLFQTLLSALRTVADRYEGISISNVATRWVLDHDFVAAVIVGVRLGVAEHKEDNAQVFTFRLSDRDRSDIEEVLSRSNGSSLINTMGDCGSEYR